MMVTTEETLYDPSIKANNWTEKRRRKLNVTIFFSIQTGHEARKVYCNNFPLEIKIPKGNELYIFVFTGGIVGSGWNV